MVEVEHAGRHQPSRDTDARELWEHGQAIVTVIEVTGTGTAITLNTRSRIRRDEV